MNKIKEAVIKGELQRVGTLVKTALKNGCDANEILKELIQGMDVVGEKFEKKEYFVPEVLLSAHTMQKGLELLRPVLFEKKNMNKGRVIIGSVEGDIHDIGKNLVAMFLEGAGFEVYNIGRDVPAEVFIQKIEEIKPHFVALSAMMTTTAEKMREIIKEFEKHGSRDNFALIVGGAALSEKLAKNMGANGYASDARKAVRMFEEIINKWRLK